MNKENLIESYIKLLIDDMDMDTMRAFVGQRLWDEYSYYSEAEIINEVRDTYPNLLGEYL